MWKLFKKILQPLYLYFTSRSYREGIHLHDKFEKKPRYQKSQVKLGHFMVQINDSVSFLNQYDELFSKQVMAFHSSTAAPLIYDCGANIGLSVLYFKKCYPQAIIKAFEADETIANLLRQNIKVNQLENVEVINKAVWINEEEVTFGCDGAQGGSIYLSSNTKQVKAIRLKNEITAEKHIDLLKIDIEGAETEVMKDCADCLEKVQNIALAYHSFPDKTQELNEILSILTNQGFRYYIQNPDKNSPLTDKETGSTGMDLLVDIFAYKEF